ncbi:MAG TPA: GntR family transcriptional regulator [Hyphomicrobiaceae bacterium]|nr:GntR family transcriptional regulator [Hyphomicrobiaceae bacterium]
MAIAQLDLQPVLIEQVENRLIEAIVGGELVAGQRLTQESAAALLGVSRQPVSHALQALKRRGLLIEHGKRGLQVAPLDAGRIRDLYRVRAALDGLAAETAAAQIAQGAASPVAIDSLHAAFARGAALPADASMAERISSDVAFHNAIYGLSGNAAIAETVAAQWPHFMRSMSHVLDDGTIRERVWDEHAAILGAILAKDGARAGELARQHTLRAGDDTALRLERAAQRSA